MRIVPAIALVLLLSPSGAAAAEPEPTPAEPSKKAPAEGEEPDTSGKKATPDEPEPGKKPTPGEPDKPSEPAPDKTKATKPAPKTSPDEPLDAPDEPLDVPDEPLDVPDDPLDVPDEPLDAPEEPKGEGTEKDPYDLGGVKIQFTERDIFRTGGSAAILDKESLERHEYDDPGSVLRRVPGVYVRTEDGYGLRPNIGLRGASSERSKKVTLMEDGVLFAPAPYAAPAAYYFPLVGRMVGVEVFKGPASIMYGPHTIGGAINFLTREVPRSPLLEASAAFGTDVFAKGHLVGGIGNEWGGFVVDALHVRSEGFKDLDGGGNTGFERTEVMLKGALNTDPSASVFSRFELKGLFGHEVSNETYMGLTDEDFRDTPYRRYASTALDRMQWLRGAATLRHDLLIGDAFDLVTTAYWSSFHRSWRKAAEFADGPAFDDVLSAPKIGIRERFYRILSGQQDSEDPSERVMLGDNTRDFLVLGIQTTGRGRFTTGPVRHEIEFGLRYHFDRIERDHTEDGYFMRSGALVADDQPTVTTTHNIGTGSAFAGYLRYGLRWEGLTVTPGVRVEVIHTELEDLLGGSTGGEGGTEVGADDQVVALPGVGITYAITDEFSVLAGVHEGFSPVAPGQPADVEPELSINYEAGVRYSDPAKATLAEAIFFFNDYSNLTGQCAFSSGCSNDELARQYNGGEVDVLGVEVSLGHRFEFGETWLQLRGAYTFTHSSFQTSFRSDDPIFGNVEEGDALPYVPPHQLSAEVGVGQDWWDVSTLLTFVDRMRESPGQGDPAPGEATDRAVYWDLMARAKIVGPLWVNVRAENLLLQAPIAARRPFGARPGKPFMFQFGLEAKVF